jgi:coenzyme F420 hydrogenase subunit beta
MVYERLQSEVIRAGLCTHCGTCAGLSVGQLEMKLTPQGPLPVPVGSGAVSLPELAYEACPGRGLNYPDLNRAVFRKLPDNWLIGNVRGVYTGYSAVPEVRRRGASGGVITQTLLYLLEQGRIDGAVVVIQGRPRPWLAEAVIARTAEDIQAASQSVYVPVPVNTVLPQMEAFEGRLAYVGLPDQVASLRRLQQAGHPAALKVDVVLGPYVGTIMYFAAIESYLRSNGVRRVDEVTELRYREGEWPGYLQIKTQSGKVLRAEKFYYNYLIPFYITRSTLLSVDFTNELTDISVGDAWHPDYEKLGQGFSVVVSRTEQGDSLLHEMQAAGVIVLEETPVERALSMHGHMIDFKKRGAFIRMSWRRALGQRAPEYGYQPHHIPPSRKLVEVIVTGLFVVAGTGLARRAVEWVPIEILGPLFNTLRIRWKEMSKPVKRKGLSQVAFDVEDNLTPQPPLHTRRGGVTQAVDGDIHVLKTTGQELRHWTRATWTFEEVGAHWDATEDYDDINEETYSYFRRFVDGLRLGEKYLKDGGRVLDYCARTGNGTLYFYQHGKVGSAVCADVSVRQGEICQERLREGGFTAFEWVKVGGYKLPFEDGAFDTVLNFETVEHFPEPALLVDDLARVTKPGGILILTTPNVLWEPVHALAAITGAHHSEGPHRFVRYRRLVDMVERAGFEIVEAETTVLVPGGPEWLIKFGDWLETRTRHSLMPWLGLRRVLICRKK